MGQSNSTTSRSSRRSRSLPQGTSSRTTTTTQFNSPSNGHHNPHAHAHAQTIHQNRARANQSQTPLSSRSNTLAHEHSDTRGQYHIPRPQANLASQESQPQHQPQQLHQQQQQQQQQHTQPQYFQSSASPTQSSTTANTTTSPSRVVHSTTRRRRLLTAFYPLLSRNSNNNSNSSNSDSINNNGNNNNEGSSSGPRPPHDHTNNSNNSHSVPESRQLSYYRQTDRSGFPQLNRNPPVRTPTIQSSTSNTRTPRGVSRVQRRYDEQSIRSFRSSSSRSSSLFAIPSSASTTQPTIPINPHVRHHHHTHHQNHPYFEPMEVDRNSATYSPGLIESLQRPYSPSELFGFNDPQSDRATSSSASGTLNPIDYIHEPRAENTLFVGLSNPRGGTSISSSLLPIRPDSEDEDEDGGALGHTRQYEQDSDFDHNQRSYTWQNGTENRERQRATRSSRYPPPDVVAELIQGQIEQGIAEAAANRSIQNQSAQEENISLPHLPSETARTSAIGEIPGEGASNTANNSNGSTSGGIFSRRDTGVHRRRLRSPSLRGLLGFQPSGSSAPRDETRNSNQSTSERREEQTNIHTGQEQRQITESQLPQFARIFVEIRRSLRGSQGQNLGSENVTPGSSGSNQTMGLSTDNDAGSSLEVTLTNPLTGGELDNTFTNGAASASTTSNEANGPPRPRRHATIHFIQIGGSNSLSNLGARHRGGTTVSGHEQPQSDQPESDTPNIANDELTDAILMFLGNSALGGSSSDLESLETTHEGGEAGRIRPRRSPWVVFTLTGAYISSLLAGAAENGEELGMSYDDLWMLSNLIGPARPVTTTQEAIDDAGFHVGQFDNASQGMRGFDILGDGSKCLVCMSEYEEGEDMRALPCKHGFHQECIDKWLTTGANKCPVCRAAAVATATSVE
ncbi:hypothetical protein BGZ76_002062 [Entomortierella beljakovae]|nr:hypothetical protein BGZ76_002062 [Entomortierella beljakovae]